MEDLACLQKEENADLARLVAVYYAMDQYPLRSWNSLNLVKVLPRVQILPPITLTRCMRLFHLKYLPTGIQTQVHSTSLASQTTRPLIQRCAVVGSLAQWLAYLIPDPLIPSVRKNILRGKKCQCYLGQSAALLRGKRTVAWKCWFNPSSAG